MSVRIRLRHLSVDGRNFVWRAEIRHVRGERDCHRCIRLRVWGAGKASRALQADLLSVAWLTPWTPCATDNAYPTSVDVRAVVRYALRHGWQPDLRGGTFLLSEVDHPRFGLPGFILTDRLAAAAGAGPAGADPTDRVIAVSRAQS